ncbi:MAG: hypothetical protein WDN27_02055 [Candidatus Saccharibacteria bacterium]
MVRKANDSGTSVKNVLSGKGGDNMGDPDSLDPVQKGLASTNGKCTGTGSTKMTYAPMAIKDIGTIAPMGSFGGAHVTPIDHEYYYGSTRARPKIRTPYTRPWTAISPASAASPRPPAAPTGISPWPTPARS